MKIKYQLNQLKEISLKVTQNFNKKIVLISGEMGAGKTTLIKEILIGLNVIDNISVSYTHLTLPTTERV